MSACGISPSAPAFFRIHSWAMPRSKNIFRNRSSDCPLARSDCSYSSVLAALASCMSFGRNCSSKALSTFLRISGSLSSGISRQASTYTSSVSMCWSITCLQIWSLSSRTCSGLRLGETVSSQSRALGVRRSLSSTTSGPTRATTSAVSSDTAWGTGGGSVAEAACSKAAWITPASAAGAAGAVAAAGSFSGAPGVARMLESTCLSLSTESRKRSVATGACFPEADPAAESACFAAVGQSAGRDTAFGMLGARPGRIARRGSTSWAGALPRAPTNAQPTAAATASCRRRSGRGRESEACIGAAAEGAGL